MDLIQRTFAETAHVEVSSFIPAPAGPHPRGSFEVLFTREVFADYVSWLMFTRPENLDILIHPLTRSQTLDHTTRALARHAARDRRRNARGRGRQATSLRPDRGIHRRRRKEAPRKEIQPHEPEQFVLGGDCQAAIERR
jgi:Dopa 4,5-dioxygenase family